MLQVLPTEIRPRIPTQNGRSEEASILRHGGALVLAAMIYVGMLAAMVVLASVAMSFAVNSVLAIVVVFASLVFVLATPTISLRIFRRLLALR